LSKLVMGKAVSEFRLCSSFQFVWITLAARNRIKRMMIIITTTT